jgi:VIT1/CCC1 family predicted Fe2+/Mn2+ transporter
MGDAPRPSDDMGSSPSPGRNTQRHRLSGNRAASQPQRSAGGVRRGDYPPTEHHHRDIQGGGARAAVFGVSDGLVSNTSLILGIAGASSAAGIVRLAGLAGLFGGAFSMAAGEYISMRAQSELFQREIEIERREIGRHPEGEYRELVHLYERRGMPPELARRVADEMMSNPELALETHAREELGIDPGSTGKPMQAAVSSFVTFAVGAFMPLIPFLFASGTTATLIAVSIAGVSALVVGGLLSLFTGRDWWFSALRQLVICAIAGAITYGIGSAIGVSGIT